MRRRQLLQRTPRVEGGEELAVLVFGPRLAGLLRQLRLAALEALDALERTRRLVERAHHQRPLIGAFRREYLACSLSVMQPCALVYNDVMRQSLANRAAPEQASRPCTKCVIWLCTNCVIERE